MPKADDSESVDGGPAHRFVHVCYACADKDAVSQLLVDGLGLDLTISAPAGHKSGRPFGAEGDIVAGMSFVYDYRGPRVGPGIEIIQWVVPDIVGDPPVDVFAVGSQAIGLAVVDPAAVAKRLTSYGCFEVGSGESPAGEKWLSVRDPRGVTLDLVADTQGLDVRARIRHLRVTCADLAQSIVWYERIGLEVIDIRPLTDAGFIGGPLSIDGQLARLRARDEPFELLLVGWTRPVAQGRHPSAANSAGLYRAAVAVEDTRSLYDELTAEGVVGALPPQPVDLPGTNLKDMWIAFLSDPNGLPVELVQRPRAAFLRATAS